MNDYNDYRCPWCGDGDFDLIGLKSHLLNDCEKFLNTPHGRERMFKGLFKERSKDA